MDSILQSIKKLLGIPSDYIHFDQDIAMHINSSFLSLNQIGIGPSGGYSIAGDAETWQSFCGGYRNLEAVKSYVYLKVRLLFDPPTSQALIEAMKNQIAELEWRLRDEVESMNQG